MEGRSYKVIAQVERGRATDPHRSRRNPCHRPGRHAHSAVVHRDLPHRGRAAHAEPLPAAQRRQDLRRGAPWARTGAGRAGGGRRQGASVRLPGRLHGRVAAAPSGGGKIPAGDGPGDRADLPGPGRAVQLVPGPGRGPGRVGAAGDVRRHDLHLPEVLRPAGNEICLNRGLDHDAEYLLPGRPGHAGRPHRQERDLGGRVRQPSTREWVVEGRGSSSRRGDPAAPHPDDDDRHRGGTLPADVGARPRRRGPQLDRRGAGGRHGHRDDLHPSSSCRPSMSSSRGTTVRQPHGSQSLRS